MDSEPSDKPLPAPQAVTWIVMTFAGEVEYAHPELAERSTERNRFWSMQVRLNWHREPGHALEGRELASIMQSAATAIHANVPPRVLSVGKIVLCGCSPMLSTPIAGQHDAIVAEIGLPPLPEGDA